MCTAFVIASIVHCYVGCGGGSTEREALHVLACDTETGAANVVQSVKGVEGTTYFQLDRDSAYLYSVIGEKREGKAVGSVVRFPIDGGKLGAMERLCELPCEAPCHVSLTSDEKRIAFAAYGSATCGTVGVDGKGLVTYTFPDDATGPHACRQKKAYAHQTFNLPEGVLGVVDLGCDRIRFFDPVTMAPAAVPDVKCTAGSGPRHAILDPKGANLYVIGELSNRVMGFRRDGSTFVPFGCYPAIPTPTGWDAMPPMPGEVSYSKAAAIKLTADGKILMASNRGDDSIAFFAVGEDGRLTLRNIAKLRGRFPRDFELMPGEKFMVVGHKMSNEIQVYRFDRAACTLEPVGPPITAWRPLCFKFENRSTSPSAAPHRPANTRETFPVWYFPIDRPHAGPVLGNASTGLMLWGGGNRLVLSLGRPGFWSHRGGAEWTATQNYRDISAALVRQDVATLDRIFPKGGERPSVMAFGRVEIVLADGVTLASAHLDMQAAKIDLELVDGRRFTVHLDWSTGTVVTAFPTNLAPASVRAVPAWHAARCRAAFERLGASPPTETSDGFEQMLPDDAGAALALRAVGNVWFASPGATLGEARATALRVSGEGVDAVAGRTAARWTEFWRDTPRVRVPNRTLQRAYEYGMFKFGASTSAEPGSVPCPLQGPWYEDYQPPPWGGDYHFNINVQECYQPAYCGNHLAHLRPLFARIEAWMPRLRENARLFVGIVDGVVLPHAVTDRGMAVTTEWWSGMIDHGSTLWVADMMWRYYAYGGSRDFLERTALPFMEGAFNVLWKMLDRDASGAFALPVAPSPEYRGAAYDAWGRNPSFQLAVARRAAEDLVAAAAALGREPDARWAELLAKLPEVTTVGEGFDREIAVWEGLALGESHRHHSHLAAVFPFDTIDCEAKEWRDLVARTFATWQGHGMGGWTGWCVPWASILQTRVGNAEAAELLLETWDRVFCNEGHNTLHNPRFTGFSQFGCWRGVMTASGGEGPVDDDLNNEIMQLDASGAATAAVVEMLIHDRRGVVRLFRGAPCAWNDCSFDRVLTPGGVLVSAARRDGRVTEIRLRATVRDTVFRYESPWKPGEIVEIPLKAGESFEDVSGR